MKLMRINTGKKSKSLIFYIYIFIYFKINIINIIIYFNNNITK